MIKQNFGKAIVALGFYLWVSAIISCTPARRNEGESHSVVTTEKENVPDSIVQFLLHSASSDFLEHQPPTPIDFRNVKIGYIKSPDNQKIFLLCGDFLSQEDRKWTGFTTIKTSGYEQYIGDTQYCKDAIIVLADDSLSIRLKNELARGLNKQH